jgi:hypothetical protein
VFFSRKPGIPRATAKDDQRHHIIFSRYCFVERCARGLLDKKAWKKASPEGGGHQGLGRIALIINGVRDTDMPCVRLPRTSIKTLNKN